MSSSTACCVRGARVEAPVGEVQTESYYREQNARLRELLRDARPFMRPGEVEAWEREQNAQLLRLVEAAGQHVCSDASAWHRWARQLGLNPAGTAAG